MLPKPKAKVLKKDDQILDVLEAATPVKDTSDAEVLKY